MATATGGSGVADLAPVQQQRHVQVEEQERRVEALVAARLDQRLQQHLAQQLDDVAGFLLDRWTDALASAASEGRHELLGALLRRLKQPSSDAVPLVRKLSAAWLAVAEKGHPQCLGLILDTCKHCPTALKHLLEAIDKDRCTALRLAAKRASPGHVECVRLLLEHSPDAQVTNPSEQGLSALVVAAMGGCTPVMQLLLAHSPGAQLVATDPLFKRTPLMWAATPGHAACLRLLLAHIPAQQVTAVDTRGQNALMHAARNSHAACLQLLLAHSPDAQISLESHDGENALSMAARRLLETQEAGCGTAGGSGSGSGGDGTHQSALTAGRECVELLLAHGAMLPDGVEAEVRDTVRRIMKELVQRARVPDMANAAVVGLALAATGRGKRAAEGEEGDAAAGGGPAAPKAARTNLNP